MSFTICTALFVDRPRRLTLLTLRRWRLRTADGAWSNRAGLLGDVALITALSLFCVGWYGYAVGQRDAWQAGTLAEVAPQLEQQCALPGLAAALIDGGKMYAAVVVDGREYRVTGFGTAYTVTDERDEPVCRARKAS